MKPPAAQSSPAAAAAAGECGTLKALAPRAWWGAKGGGSRGVPFPRVPILPCVTLPLAGSAAFPAPGWGHLTGAA